MKKRSPLGLGGVTCLVAVLCVPATHAMIHVTTTADSVIAGDGSCSLREAIHNANLPLGGDTTAGDCNPGAAGPDDIILGAGVHLISIFGPGEDANNTGDFDLLDTVGIFGVGPGATILDGGFGARVLDAGPFAPGIGVEVSGLTIRAGLLPGAGGAALRVAPGVTVNVTDADMRDNAAVDGGAILNSGSLFLQNVELAFNVAATPAGRGGALLNRGETELIDSLVANNRSDGDGGAVFNEVELRSTNSSFEANTAQRFGGALYNVSVADLDGAQFVDNRADTFDGGAIFHDGTMLDVLGGSIEQSFALRQGGGILSLGDTVLTSVELRLNEAPDGGGGVAHLAGTLIASDVVFDRNRTDDIGGGLLNRADATLELVDLVGNEATARGGGAFNDATLLMDACEVESNLAFTGAGLFNNGSLTMRHSHMAFNRAQSTGGGLTTFAGSQADLENCTVSQNECGQSGGGIEVNQGQLLLEFSTVALNTASGGPGGGVFSHTLANFEVKNSILEENMPDDCGSFAGSTSHGYSMDSDGSCPLFGPGDLAATFANLGPLAYHGGATKSHSLTWPASSFAIDSADPGCKNRAGLVVGEDQRLVLRPQDGDGNGFADCDRGAYEAPALAPSAPGPVPNGIFGPPLRASRIDPAGTGIQLGWNVSVCPGVDYHLIHGPLSTVGSYVVSGSRCNLGTSGSAAWLTVPAGSHWFLILENDGAQTEGSWGDATGGIRNAGVPSAECGLPLRDDTGTCP